MVEPLKKRNWFFGEGYYAEWFAENGGYRFFINEYTPNTVEEWISNDRLSSIFRKAETRKQFADRLDKWILSVLKKWNNRLRK